MVAVAPVVALVVALVVAVKGLVQVFNKWGDHLGSVHQASPPLDRFAEGEYHNEKRQ